MKSIHRIFLLFNFSLFFLYLVQAASNSASSSGPPNPYAPPSIPRMVRSHHLQEAKQHLKQGTKGATESLKKGASASGQSLSNGCRENPDLCPLTGFERLLHGVKNARSGCAGCINTSAFATKGIAKNLAKSVTEPKIQRTLLEFEQKRQNDQRIRQDGYNRLKSETNSITPALPPVITLDGE